MPDEMRDERVRQRVRIDAIGRLITLELRDKTRGKLLYQQITKMQARNQLDRPFTSHLLSHTIQKSWTEGDQQQLDIRSPAWRDKETNRVDDGFALGEWCLVWPSSPSATRGEPADRCGRQPSAASP
jgi:hypothetical protein